MKKLAKLVVVSILGWQVKRLRQKNSFTVVAVAGSVGKTSTKLAIANVLTSCKKVRFQQGNYNDLTSVPLIFFGLDMPSLMNPLAWVAIFLKIESQLRKPFGYEIVVVELGTDGPGQIAAFKRYLNVDIGVLTAVRPEHMEYFEDLDAVAKEELAITELSKTMVVNSDLVDEKYLNQLQQKITYSINSPATYQIVEIVPVANSLRFSLRFNGVNILTADYKAISNVQLYSIGAASAVAHELGMTNDQIVLAISSVAPVNGRMNLLKGVNGSTIIDDTYNASPDATKAAIAALYMQPAPQKIAILGNMNELGKYSADAHTEIGKLCNPKELELVITIGPDANKYLAAAAEKQGCQVKRYTNPYKAGAELQGFVRPGAFILAKGSQNGVFAEEAVKLLLADSKDSVKLVRQSAEWQNRKHKTMAKII